MLLKIKVDLGARYLEVWFFHLKERGFSTREILLNPRDSSQPERLFSTREIVLNQRDCLLIVKEKQKYLSKTKTAKEEQPTIKKSTRNQ